MKHPFEGVLAEYRWFGPILFFLLNLLYRKSPSTETECFCTWALSMWSYVTAPKNNVTIFGISEYVPGIISKGPRLLMELSNLGLF